MTAEDHPSQPVPSDQVPGLFAPHGSLDERTLNVDDAHDSDGAPWLVSSPPRRVIAARRFREVLARRRANRTRRI